ncbi:hypothetical protein DSO57_1016877 [Entomophthora muscae]|uniref:Uncharacterized protein n=1 Tax=Entomophthora muscae TaxID=34485 RepID=A0ACC2TRV6_9FUNG|nr:hypothetical protein DSO57_1016877 [Entomophthora muscae]
MSCWQDDNKVLSHKIASLEAKLLEFLSQEGNGNKRQGQDNVTLPAYNLRMEPPVTPKPMPASSPGLPTDYTGKLFGIVYITLTGVIDTIIPAAGLWSWVGKSFSYLFKLAPLLWWALPVKTWPK